MCEEVDLIFHCIYVFHERLESLRELDSLSFIDRSKLFGSK